MPRYTATTAYSAAIAVAVGDIVQNTGRYGVLVCAQATASDDDAVEILPNKGVRISRTVLPPSGVTPAANARNEWELNATPSVGAMVTRPGVAGAAPAKSPSQPSMASSSNRNIRALSRP